MLRKLYCLIRRCISNYRRYFLGKVKYNIFCNNETVRLEEWFNKKTQSREICWEEIVRVLAFKQDLFVASRICIYVSKDKEDKNGQHFDEGMDGWDIFLETMYDNLEGCKKINEFYSNADIDYPIYDSDVHILYDIVT